MFELNQLPARKQAGNRIKFRILIPLVLALGVLLATFAFAIWRVQQKELAKAADFEAQEVEHRLHAAENQKTAMLKTTIEAVMNDGQLTEAFRKRDPAALLERAKPLFDSLRSEHGVTHFYFHLPDRTVLLRVHDPDVNRDKIDRHTMLEAERTGKVSVGIERGLTGIFTLRVVSPWRQDGQLLGYLELGVEFEKIVADIHNELSKDVDFVVAVNKKFLDREQWAAAAKRQGRTNDWNRFPRMVVINKTVETLPQPAVRYLLVENLKPKASWRGGNSQLVFLPLTDVTGEDLGKVIVLKKAAQQMAETSRSIQFVVVLSLAVGAVVIVFFYFFLTGVENDLSERTAKLKNEIAERQGAERMLRESEAQLQTIVENLDEGLIVSDLNGQLPHWNRAALKLHGYSHSDQDRRRFTELTDTFELSALDGAPLSVEQWPLARILRGEKVHDLELRVRRVGSNWQRIFHYGGTLVHDANNQPLMAIVTIGDITERKRVEERLREQADMLNRAHDAIIVRNFEDQNIVFWNTGAERLYGWSASEAIGQPVGELILANPQELETIAKGLLSTGEFRGQLKQITKDKRELTVEVWSTLIRNDDGTPRSVLSINNDITEQKKLETQLLRAQRLESIGTLASGIAHDLNNVLAPILMCAQTLRGDLAEEDRQSAISLIEESAQRGARVVKQVLTFARGVEGKRVLIKPSHLIEEIVDIARKTFPKSIEISGRYSKDLWTIQGDPTQLHQVLLNLAVNARDAMASGGSLTFAVENFTADEHYAAMTPGAKVGRYIALCVSDSGAGMPRATIDKIFDPFFTTKEFGKGTGLGLSTALGIVQSHGGFISVYSELGKGTTFKIFLPATMSDEDLQKSKTAVAPIQGNGEQILVVDDEANILQITKMIFEKHNYRVVSASDGPQALALFAQQMDSIGGVLTDIAMPYMDGVTLVRALRKMKSDIPIIASTGQGDQAGMAELRLLGVKNFLTKPYNTEELLATVHETLQGHESLT